MTAFAFLDCETTGLSPRDNHILEVAWVFTDYQFNVLSRSPQSYIVDHGEDEAEVAQQIKDSPFITNMHSESGLLRELADPEALKLPMEKILDTFIQDVKFLGLQDDQVRLAGYSVSFDREFLRHNGWGSVFNEDSSADFHMHHRILDLSSVIQLYAAAGRDVPVPAVQNANPHRALDDALDALHVAQGMRDDLKWS